MPKRLTLAEQRTLMTALPASRKKACEAYCKKAHMKGEGIKDILKGAAKILGPVAKEIGPTVMKELIIPMIKKQMGMGLNLPGGGLNLPGGALKLAGQGEHKKEVKHKKK